MCIAILCKKGKRINKETLRTCWENNPHGGGFMYAVDGQLVVRKGFMKFGSFYDALTKAWKTGAKNAVTCIHLRIATHGNIDKANCHPWRIGKDAAVIHNGILSCVSVPKDSPISDTGIYARDRLAQLPANFIVFPEIVRLIGAEIGGFNKMVFLAGKGHWAIANEDKGIWKDDIWYSNTSYHPRPKIVITNDATTDCNLYSKSSYWSEKQDKPEATSITGHLCKDCRCDIDDPKEISTGYCTDCIEGHFGCDVADFIAADDVSASDAAEVIRDLEQNMERVFSK